MPSVLLIVSGLAALAPLAARSMRTLGATMALGATAIFALALWVAVPPLLGAPAAAEGLWYVDALAALMVALIGFVQWTAILSSVSYLKTEVEEGVIEFSQARRYASLAGLFILSMLATVVADNLGLMWVALEATTLATTLLVAFYAHKGSLEAAWKYLILCSTGISLGLLGLLITYYAALSGAGVEGFSAISWSALFAVAPSLSPTLMHIAFAFVLIGYGTKAGFVPMHNWLPDAHSRAPAPISGLLSGVLLNAALFSILRYKQLVDASSGGGDWTNGLLLVFGVLSCVIPVGFILLQSDYKRFLAYSSIEHMGLIAFSIGLGAWGALAGLIHLVGHSLAKSMLFFGAGEILLRFRSTKFERVRGAIRAMPYTGSLFLVGLLALLATPPSPLFTSEYLLVARGVGGHPYLTAVVLAALAVIFAGFIRLMMPLLFSPQDTEGGNVETGERFGLTQAAMLLHVLLMLAFGFALWSGYAYPVLERAAILIS